MPIRRTRQTNARARITNMIYLTQEMKDTVANGFDSLLESVRHKTSVDYMHTHLKDFISLVSKEAFESVRKEVKAKQQVFIDEMYRGGKVDEAALAKLCEQT